LYYQVENPDGLFVLDPTYSDDVGSYETHDGEIKVLITNKKDISRFCRACFGKSKYEFDRKIGPFNQYTIELKQPIKLYDGITADSPPYEETVVFHLKVHIKELTERDYRSELLSSWVLGVSHPTQFNRLLKSNFDVSEVVNDYVVVKPKVLNVAEAATAS
jgi:hypothetical protein